MQKASQGGTLSAWEQPNLSRVKQEIREHAAGKNPNDAPQGTVGAPQRLMVVNQEEWKPLIPIADVTSPYP